MQFYSGMNWRGIRGGILQVVSMVGNKKGSISVCWVGRGNQPFDMTKAEIKESIKKGSLLPLEQFPGSSTKQLAKGC